MKTVVTVALLFVALSATLAAQWPAYLRPDVPRLADGTPDLDAPAPRLPNGKPDLSGVWESRLGPSGALGGRPVPSLGDGAPPLATFVDIGRNMEGGLPFTEWGAALRKERMSTNSMDNPDAHCLPPGLMQLHTHSQPRKVVQTPTDMVIMYEANYGLRNIVIDGRPAPDNDPQPWWDGYSRGWWDNDDLIVETTHFRDMGWLDVFGSYFGTGTTITERFRRVSYGRMEIDVTVEDEKAYTRPFTVRVNWRLAPDQQLIEFVCNENEQSSEHLVAPGN